MKIAFLSSLNYILAHPGHGTIPADSPAHYVLEPAHSVWLILFLAISAAMTLLFFAMRKRQSLRGTPARVTVRRRPTDSRDGT